MLAAVLTRARTLQRVQAAFEYISSYSPLSNLRPGAAYPALLLTASLYDTRVNFWCVAAAAAGVHAA